MKGKMNRMRKYPFSWKLIGDSELGRPNLGPWVRLEVYRLMQHGFRDVIEAEYGTEASDRIFFRTGHLAGLEFFRNLIGGVDDSSQFMHAVQSLLHEMGIGILRTEEVDWEKDRLVFTVSEDLDCSGLPEMDFEFCTFDEGFFAGLLEGYSGKKFNVKEVDCWCTGERTCRFEAQAIG
jgi:predicted hydrocarbon binding protein